MRVCAKSQRANSHPKRVFIGDAAGARDQQKYILDKNTRPLLQLPAVRHDDDASRPPMRGAPVLDGAQHLQALGHGASPSETKNWAPFAFFPSEAAMARTPAWSNVKEASSSSKTRPKIETPFPEPLCFSRSPP